MAVFSEHWNRPRPLLFGHRGHGAAAPMNTLAAFERAAQAGADGVELDVQLTRDGHVIVLHDFSVDATTDGNGMLADFTLAEVKSLDAGAWFGAEFRGQRIPTLAEVFAAAGARLLVNVELKTRAREDEGLERAVAQTIVAAGMEARVLVSSFNPLALTRFRACMPQVPIGYLYSAQTPAKDHALVDELRHEASHPEQGLIDATLMALARSSGRRVHAWTVNDFPRARELAALGVDMLITDEPGKLRQAL